MDFVLGRLMTIATFLVLLAILIFFHELGHFLAAKLFRMRVEEFALGFGKRLVRVGFDGETEYNVRAIPLGGFVRIAGMEVEEMMERRLTTAGDQKSGEQASETTNVGLLEQEVAEVSGADPNGFNNRPVYQRFLVILAGPTFSIALAWLVFCLVAAIYGIPDTSVSRIRVLPGSLAAQAGLRSGDAILAVNGAPVDGVPLSETIRSSPGKPLRLTVRSGERAAEFTTRTVVVTPRSQTENGKVIGRIGIEIGGYPPTMKRVPVAEAFRLDNWYMRRSLEDLGALFRKGINRDSLSGPVGIVQITDRVRQAGLPSLLLLLGGLSFSIGLFNLLPIPILDGGHLTLLTLEGIRGRKLTAEQMWRVQLTGLAIIFTLFVLVTFNDISRFFRPG